MEAKIGEKITMQKTVNQKFKQNLSINSTLQA